MKKIKPLGSLRGLNNKNSDDLLLMNIINTSNLQFQDISINQTIPVTESIDDYSDTINMEINEAVTRIVSINNENFIKEINGDGIPLQEGMIFTAIKMIINFFKKILKFIRSMWDKVRNKFLIYSQDCSKFMRVYDNGIKNAQKARKVADYTIVYKMVDLQKILSSAIILSTDQAKKSMLDTVAPELITNAKLNINDLKAISKSKYEGLMAQIDKNKEAFEKEIAEIGVDTEVVLAPDVVKRIEDVIRNYKAAEGKIKEFMNGIYNTINSSRNAIENSIAQLEAEANKKNDEQAKQELAKTKEGTNAYIQYIQKAVSFVNTLVAKQAALDSKILKQCMGALRKHLASYSNKG